jgi:hypothetical protein
MKPILMSWFAGLASRLGILEVHATELVEG